MTDLMAVVNSAIDYGYYELKKIYQRNFVKGIASSLILHLSLIGLYFGVLKAMEDDEAVTIRTVKIMKYTDLGPPPSVEQKQATPPPPTIQQAAVKPSMGIPVPVPDIDISPEQTMATQEDLAVPTAIEGVGDAGEIAVEGGTGDILNEAEPGMDDFVAVEQEPQKVKWVNPDYPKLAKDAGIEGKVLVKVLIDKEGKVKKAVIVKGNEIFHDSVMKAALQCTFTPAIQNQKPVQVWMMIPFNFQLH